MLLDCWNSPFLTNWALSKLSPIILYYKQQETRPRKGHASALFWAAVPSHVGTRGSQVGREAGERQLRPKEIPGRQHTLGHEAGGHRAREWTYGHFPLCSSTLCDLGELTQSCEPLYLTLRWLQQDLQGYCEVWAYKPRWHSNTFW